MKQISLMAILTDSLMNLKTHYHKKITPTRVYEKHSQTISVQLTVAFES